jgi:predicted transcriptional regulator
LEEQIDNIIFGQLSNYEDFENCMKCVVKDDNMWNEAFNKQSGKCLVVFQLGKGNDKEAQGITNAHNKVDVKQQSKLEIKF